MSGFNGKVCFIAIAALFFIVFQGIGIETQSMQITQTQRLAQMCIRDVIMASSQKSSYTV
jgi:hypothetical protein